MRHIFLAAVAMVSLQAVAVPLPRDTAYFYETWEQMLNQKPKAMVLNPVKVDYSPCETDFEGLDKNTRKFMGVSLGDSVWYINSDYLKEYFEVGSTDFNGYIPLYFNEKVAFVTYYGKLKLMDLLFGNADNYHYTIDYYYIDFLNHEVNQVTHKYLSHLLEQYPDLKVRYEGMKNYKDPDVIEDYFFKYIDRATEDIMRPYIVDLN